MSYKYLFLLLWGHSLLIGSQETLNNTLKSCKNLYHYKDPTSIVNYIASHNTRFALDRGLEGTQLLEQTNYFLQYIKDNAKNIEIDTTAESLLTFYHFACEKKGDKSGSAFLSEDVLSEVFYIFCGNGFIAKKDCASCFISKIKNPLLLNTLIYKNDILKHIYTVPRHKISCNSDIIKKGFNFGVETSMKVINAFRKKENSINSNASETIANNKSLLPSLLNTRYLGGLFCDNVLYCAKTQNSEVHKTFLKVMFQPYDYKELPPCYKLSSQEQNKILKTLLGFKFWSKNNKKIFPKPIQKLILAKLTSYEHAQRTRDYLLTEIALLTLNYLDGKENFNQNIKETILFVKNDFIPWFDLQVKRL